MALSGAQATISSQIYLRVRKTNAPLQDLRAIGTIGSALNFTALGTGAGAFNQIYTETISIIASGVVTLNFFDGTITGDLTANLLNPFDEQIVSTQAFARIKEIEIRLLSTVQSGTAATGITFGPGASNPFTGPFGGTTPTMQVLNGGRFCNGVDTDNGWTVNNTTKTLTITNQDAAVAASVSIIVLGNK